MTTTWLSRTANNYYFGVLFIISALVYFAASAGTARPIVVDQRFVVFFAGLLLVSPIIVSRGIGRQGWLCIVWIMFAGLLSTVASGVPSAFLYSIGPILLICVSSQRKIAMSRGYNLALSISIAVILLLIATYALTLFKSGFMGRQSLPQLGNPNYSAMIYVGFFISIDILFSNRNTVWKMPILIYASLLMFYVITITATRSAMLAVTLFLLARLMLFLNLSKLLRTGLHLLVIVSVVGQGIAYFIFTNYVRTTAGRSTSGFADASNNERAEAFYTSFLHVIADPMFLYTGLGDADAVVTGSTLTVPHNWFMMMWLGNGLLFTLALAYTLFFAVAKLPSRMLPGFASILLIAGALGRSVMFNPLCLFMLCCCLSTAVAYDRMNWKRSAATA